MMDEDLDELLSQKDRRKKKDKKRSHKQSEKEEFAKESLKKMREEIEELRKRENDRTKEIDELKKKVESQQNQTVADVETEYALDFDRDAYLSKGFIESAKWIKDVLSKNMLEKMSSEQNKERFETLLTAKKMSRHLGVRTCARFNRGEPCNQGKWHSTHATRPEALWTRHGHQSSQDERSGGSDHGKKNDLRLHSCTLCIETLGAAYGHGILDCPWIMKKNWNE
jgi:hypothetical protein